MGKSSGIVPDIMNVGVVEDDRGQQIALSTILTNLGHNVRGVFASAEEFLEKYAGLDLHIVFIDHNLPDKSGLDLTRLLEKTQLAVILATGTTDSNILAQLGAEWWVVDLLLKPFDEDVVRRRLSFARGRIKVQREAAKRATEREVIEEAKAVLCKARNCGEEQAYQILKERSKQQSRRVYEIAKDLIFYTELVCTGKDSPSTTL